MNNNDDDIVLVSTTDSDEEVQTALTGKPITEADASKAIERRVADAPEHDQVDVPPALPSPKLDDADANGDPVYATYEAWMAAHAAHTVYEADRRVLARESSRARIATHTAKIKDFAKAHAPDFDAVIKGAQDAARGIVTELGPSAFTIIDRYTTVDADNGPAIIYHLAKNKDEMEEIAKLPVPQQLIALARLDARLGGAPARSSRRSVATSSPRVAAAAAGSDGNGEPVDADDYQEYKAKRNAEERAGRSFRF